MNTRATCSAAPGPACLKRSTGCSACCTQTAFPTESEAPLTRGVEPLIDGRGQPVKLNQPFSGAAPAPLFHIGPGVPGELLAAPGISEQAADLSQQMVGVTRPEQQTGFPVFDHVRYPTSVSEIGRAHV